MKILNISTVAVLVGTVRRYSWRLCWYWIYIAVVIRVDSIRSCIDIHHNIVMAIVDSSFVIILHHGRWRRWRWRTLLLLLPTEQRSTLIIITANVIVASLEGA